MEKTKRVGSCLVVIFLLGFIVALFSGLAGAESREDKAERKVEEKAAERKADQKALKEGLEETLGMPVLKGEVWQKMVPDSKVAFIWGFGHVVSIEQHLMEKFPELKRDSFVAKVVEGMADMPMAKVVAQVDEYYASNPNKIETPVTNVMWDLMIKPNIKTGIAGHSLNN